MGRELDPLRAYSFTVIVPGMGRSRFKSVEGLKETTSVIAYGEGGDAATDRKIPGKTTYENITLKRGIASDNGMKEWRDQVFSYSRGFTQTGGATNAEDFRRVITIIQHDKAGREMIEWEIYACWPCEMELDALDFESEDQLSIETMVLCNEGIEKRVLNNQLVPPEPT